MDTSNRRLPIHPLLFCLLQTPAVVLVAAAACANYCWIEAHFGFPGPRVFPIQIGSALVSAFVLALHFFPQRPVRTLGRWLSLGLLLPGLCFVLFWTVVCLISIVLILFALFGIGILATVGVLFKLQQMGEEWLHEREFGNAGRQAYAAFEGPWGSQAPAPEWAYRRGPHTKSATAREWDYGTSEARSDRW